jgi:hypothetical protein
VLEERQVLSPPPVNVPVFPYVPNPQEQYQPLWLRDAFPKAKLGAKFMITAKFTPHSLVDGLVVGTDYFTGVPGERPVYHYETLLAVTATPLPDGTPGFVNNPANTFALASNDMAIYALVTGKPNPAEVSVSLVEKGSQPPPQKPGPKHPPKPGHTKRRKEVLPGPGRGRIKGI